jgi:S-adenosyl-L-methionine methyltransferase
MTRLDSAIRRLMAQRDLLDWAAREIARVPGLVLELGLGNGRTYDHLRARLPERAIYVFERLPAAHPSCTPAPDRLLVGDVCETLPRFADQIGPGSVALIHADLGSGDEVGNRVFCRELSPLVAPLLAPGGLLLADQSFDMPGFREIAGKAGIDPGRYFAYRRSDPGDPESSS